MPRRKITDDMRRRAEFNRQQAILDAGGGPPTRFVKHHSGERVVSIAGWSGTVTSVQKTANGTWYGVRWDKSHKVGRVPACMLKP